MFANRIPCRKLLSISLLLCLSACATRREIPAPTVPVPEPRQLSEADGITAPPQRAWQWDANRWFTAELDHRCRGPIRFVDERNGIDTYVGNEDVPAITFASDDPDVVLAMLAGYRNQLVFSTDGGRRFVQEVRRLPADQTTKFVIVKQGQVYVGMQLFGPDGYFKWQRPGFRNAWQQEPSAVEVSQLVILAAPLDKANSRIGSYMVVAPTDYQFRSEYADGAQDYIKRIDNIETLGLPHSAQAAPSDTCGRTLALPPWSSGMDKEELIEFYNWYDTMKAAHPGWADAASDYFIAWHRNWHRAVLIPGATTPTR
jgi:hypothetical protein